MGRNSDDESAPGPSVSTTNCLQKHTVIIWKTSFSHLSPLSSADSFFTAPLFLPPPPPPHPPCLLPPPPSPDSIPPCNYHLRLQLKDTTIKRAEEGDRGAVRDRKRGRWSERRGGGGFNETFIHTHAHTNTCAPIHKDT